ncbi:hypothetical protein SAMN04488118_11727 [Epibacterium ulvae]|uniref:DNA cytosine methyltransferase n=1 Tax=Epibacterium ulvae TaxID=1156985 RepID=A0A1G5RJA1_9RHOB|nr:hypothetical protein [Epibacterium ulvae]SCZ73451.1 hypothetical protein SAMN04488118_11727 [Epibacterium ulvae]
MRVLIGCECSGTVRDAFLAAGHDAYSCDLKPDEKGSNRHFVADIRDVLRHPEIYGRFDLVIICHPPCTRLCNSGVRWYTEPPQNPPSSCTEAEAEQWPFLDREQRLAMLWEHLDQGAALFQECLDADVPYVAIENPVMHRYAKERINFGDVKPFYVQPWQFATTEGGPDNEKKRTGFWCRNLPKLTPTGTLDGSTARDSVHKASPGEDRGAERSRFFPGMAAAMADQWGSLPAPQPQQLDLFAA